MANLLQFLSGSNPVAALVDATVGKVVDKALDFIPDPAQKAQFQKDMATMEYAAEAKQADADVAQLQAVNATMQEELKNSSTESWYQKAWRPANGFCVALGSFLGVVTTCWLFYLALLGSHPEAIAAIPQLASSIAMILAVPGAAVGIAAWHRGMLQRESAQSDDDSAK